MLNFESLGGALGGLLGKKGKHYGGQAGGLADWMLGAPDANNPNDPSLLRIPFLNIGITSPAAAGAHHQANAQKHLFDHQAAVQAEAEAAGRDRRAAAWRQGVSNLPGNAPINAAYKSGIFGLANAGEDIGSFVNAFANTGANTNYYNTRANLLGTRERAASNYLTGVIPGQAQKNPDGSPKYPPETTHTMQLIDELLNTIPQSGGMGGQRGGLMVNPSTGDVSWEAGDASQAAGAGQVDGLATLETEEVTQVANSNLPVLGEPKNSMLHGENIDKNDPSYAGAQDPAPAADPRAGWPSRKSSGSWLPFQSKSQLEASRATQPAAQSSEGLTTIFHKEADGTQLPAGHKLIELAKANDMEGIRQFMLQYTDAERERIMKDAEIFLQYSENAAPRP